MGIAEMKNFGPATVEWPFQISWKVPFYTRVPKNNRLVQMDRTSH